MTSNKIILILFITMSSSSSFCMDTSLILDNFDLNNKHIFFNNSNNISDISESRNVDNTNCEITYTSRLKELNSKMQIFYISHEIAHCVEKRDYIYKDNKYPTLLNEREKEIYNNNKSDYLSGKYEHSLGIVYQEMLSDGEGIRVLKKLGGNEEDFEYIYAKRMNDWSENPCSSYYPTMGVIDKIRKMENPNSIDVRSAVNKEYKNYLLFYKSKCKPLQE